jgi:alanine racemase
VSPTETVPSIESRLAAAGLPPLPRTAWLELDLDALTANLAVIRRLAGDGVPVHPVVKADAYGHGAEPIAIALERAGADGLCVAALDEALALRASGVGLPILVLYPVPAAWASEAAAKRIGLSAGDPRLLDELLAAWRPTGGARTDGTGGAELELELELELEVETGLGRGGFTVERIADAAARIAVTRGTRLRGLWTHLQAPEDVGRTAAQLRRFEAASEGLRAAGLALPPRHVAASAGLLVDGVAAYGGIRPGLALYGIVPDELAGRAVAADAAALRPVMSLHARPVRVADLPAGWGVSYGPTWTTGRPSRIATLPLGYGDGWPRSLSNRAEALVRGRRVPIVGNVAMDAVMADVTDVPGRPVDIDDAFVLLGRQGDDAIAAGDLARWRATNSWEVVTGMSRRVPRVYHSAAGPLVVRTLTGTAGEWLPSNSGTATSATSRSTRS